MRILLLSAYDAASHRRWREGLVAQFPEHDWRILTLPARHFSWRIRGNSLTWAMSDRGVLEQEYDLVVATSMVDLSTLKGLVPKLANVPSIAYFHENQFAYPSSGRQFDSVDPQMVTLYTALAADRLAFNSDYNRVTFLRGVETLLARFPDAVPTGIVAALAEQSVVLPIPLEDACFAPRSMARSNAQPLHVVWNHRWEYDKGPDRLLGMVECLLALDVEFELSVLGQSFREQPPAFDALRRRLDDNPGTLRHWGHIDSVDRYRRHLQSADVALSTSLHDFQGLAILEAVAAGCLPLVPDRLCYGEWFGPEFRYASSIDDAGLEAGNVAASLRALATRKRTGSLPPPPDMQPFAWARLAEGYAALLSSSAS
ncbi:MAG: tRNA-queuosine alpha-mannosyltransferase domain-containing protein [Gammaproteobacteria bacterium]